MNAFVEIQPFLDRLRLASEQAQRPMTFMEVCGTHTTSAFRSGLHSLMPAGVKLLSGPGCPVCVTAQSDIDLLIELANVPHVTLCTYGDMIRVPGAKGSLERARGNGADVRVVYSSLDAVKFAAENPGRQVVFAAVGFETTAPATAVSVLEAQRRGLENYSVLASHKRVLPAMHACMGMEKIKVDGFLCPGHVSIVVGAEIYRPLVEQHKLPCVITGFEEVHMASGLAILAEQVRDGKADLINDYHEAVSPDGNKIAQTVLEEVFEFATVRWRGIGTIDASGLVLRSKYHRFDAQRRFGLAMPEDREPKGCLCGEVITAQIEPPDCPLFAKACTPVNPIGPCMVSSEGTCQAWFKYNRPRLRKSPNTRQSSPAISTNTTLDPGSIALPVLEGQS